MTQTTNGFTLVINERLLKEAGEIANHLNLQDKGEFTKIDVQEFIDKIDWDNAKKEDFMLKSVNKMESK
jgi:hypothetical protein